MASEPSTICSECKTRHRLEEIYGDPGVSSCNPEEMDSQRLLSLQPREQIQFPDLSETFKDTHGSISEAQRSVPTSLPRKPRLPSVLQEWASGSGQERVLRSLRRCRMWPLTGLASDSYQPPAPPPPLQRDIFLIHPNRPPIFSLTPTPGLVA